MFFCAVPPASTKVSAVKVCNRISLTWDEPEDPLHRSCDISHYRVITANITGGFAFTYLTNITSMTTDRLAPGNTFLFSAIPETVDDQIGLAEIVQVDTNCELPCFVKNQIQNFE